MALHLPSLHLAILQLPDNRNHTSKAQQRACVFGEERERERERERARDAMSALTTLTTIQPAAIKGMGGSSLAGRRLFVKPIRQNPTRAHVRPGAIVAKYGEKSVYFDLEDLGNTTGQWDLYGSDAPSPYNSLQSKFFETFAAPFTKRGLLLKFLLLAGGSALAYFSATASSDILPIKKGPQLPPQRGPRGKL